MLLSLVFQFILTILGWEEPSKDMIERLTSKEKVIVVISHTTYADFWIMVLHRLAYPHLFDGIRFVVKPEPFKKYSWLLGKLGCIKSTSINETGGGFVTSVSDQINDMEVCRLFISPKGTIVKARWKTGYYYIARSTKSYVIGSGFDYEKKTFVTTKLRKLTKNGVERTFDELSSIVKDDMRVIVPLNSGWSEIEFECKSPHMVSAISYTKLASFIATFPICVYLIFIDDLMIVYPCLIVVMMAFLLTFNDVEEYIDCVLADLYIVATMVVLGNFYMFIASAFYWLFATILCVVAPNTRSNLHRPIRALLYVFAGSSFLLYLANL